MIVNSVKPFVYYFKSKSFNIFDPVFKLHTKLTVYFLLICSILISGHSWTGKPLDCIIDKDRKALAEVLCWANRTFTVEKTVEWIDGHRMVREVQHYQRYYQWVVIILLVEAALLSISERLWKVWEHGRIQQLCGCLNAEVLSSETESYKNDKERVVSYLKLKNSRIHGSYVFRYVCCEVINFLCVVFNMFIFNVVFERFWNRYLPAVASLFTTEGPTFSNLAGVIFPITAKFLLLLISGLNLIWRSVTLLSPSLRLKMIQSSTKWAGQLSRKEVKMILPIDNIGDWFIMYLLGQNLNRFAFREILDELAESKESFNNDNV